MRSSTKVEGVTSVNMEFIQNNRGEGSLCSHRYGWIS